jgi:hypothetical protein
VNVGIVRCRGCGRRLTAPASVAAERGRRCRARLRDAAAVAGAGAEQVAKALELIADGGIVPTSHAGVFRTVGSKGDVIYLTHSNACTCPSGLHRLTASICYHSLAVRIILAADMRRAA